MSFLYASIFLSVIIGMLIIAKIRSYDIYEKEAFTSMFLAFVAGGGASVVISLGFYGFLKPLGIDDAAISNPAGSFLIIGPVEEFSKLVGLMIVYWLISKQFNEVTDGVIYMACVALGFSVIENYFYANSGENNEFLLVYRALICTPAHISFSCITGYAFYRFRKEKKPFMSLFYAFIFASILHGIYDALAFSEYLRFLLIFFLYAIIHQSLKIVQYSNIVSPFRPTFKDLFNECSPNATVETECPYCHKKTNRPKYENAWFTAFRCDSCGYFFTEVKYLERMFRSFAPEYKRFRKKIFPVKLSDNAVYQSIYGAAFFRTGEKMGFFKVNDVSERINLINQTICKNFRKVTFIPKKILSGIID